MVSPLMDLTWTNKAWNWTDKCTEAFKKEKYSLNHALVLWMPNFLKPFEVVTNASKLASGGMPMQEGQLTAFDSRKFNKAESNYIINEQEMLVLLCIIQIWQCYLQGPSLP